MQEPSITIINDSASQLQILEARIEHLEKVVTLLTADASEPIKRQVAIEVRKVLYPRPRDL